MLTFWTKNIKDFEGKDFLGMFRKSIKEDLLNSTWNLNSNGEIDLKFQKLNFWIQIQKKWILNLNLYSKSKFKIHYFKFEFEIQIQNPFFWIWTWNPNPKFIFLNLNPKSKFKKMDFGFGFEIQIQKNGFWIWIWNSNTKFNFWILKFKYKFNSNSKNSKRHHCSESIFLEEFSLPNRTL